MPESSRPRPLVTGGTARALSWTCHKLHIVILLFIVLGWAVPVNAVLWAHIILVPLILWIWYLNSCSCPLNNIESYLLKGLWRDPDNREEGSFVVVVVEQYLGMKPTQKTMDIITYAIMCLAWVLSGVHLWLRTEA